MTQPETSPAEPGAVAYLLSRLNTDSPLQRVTMQPRRSGRFRLIRPRRNGHRHPGGWHRTSPAAGGGQTSAGNARYAVIDPETWPPAADCHGGDSGAGGL